MEIKPHVLTVKSVKNLNMLNREIFHTLAQVNTPNCVSIYVPGYPSEQGMESRSFLKKMLNDAADRLKQSGMSDKDARAYLFNGYELLNETERWKQLESSYALFIGPEIFEALELNRQVSPRLIVDQRFYLLPLISEMSTVSEFYVLALGESAAGLYRGDANSIQPVPADEQLPANMDAALQMDTEMRNVQMNRGAAAFDTPIFEGDEMGHDHRLKQYKRYCYQVDQGVQAILEDANAPVVLATTDQIAPIYKETSDYTDIAPVHISGTPEQLSHKQMHKQALDIIHDFHHHRKDRKIEGFSDYDEKELASSSVFEILPRAHKGEVETLFVAEGQKRWGTFDPKSGKVELHKSRQKDSEDLINLTAIYAFLRGAGIFLVNQDDLPNSSTSINAIYKSGNES